MRIESTRTPAAAPLRHAAGFHTDADDLLAQLAPLVTAALQRGEPVATALRPATEAALVAALGAGAELVPLTMPADPHALSGQTLAVARARELRELTTARGRVTAVTEHQDRFDGPDGLFWTELDAACAVALEALPVDLTCFFPDLPLHQSVTDGALRTHPSLYERGSPRPNPQHLAPHEVLLDTPAPAPMVLGPPDLRRAFRAWELNEVRAVVEKELIGAGFGTDRAEDVVLAVNEIATNAVEHGGDAEIAVWTGPDGFVFEVHDHGDLADPLPGLVAPQPSETRGRGVWIARQLCDFLHVWADGVGTHVRIRAVP
jgi:anti-sigma regulatory factor (Ser/Thr protein kinase)